MITLFQILFGATKITKRTKGYSLCDFVCSVAKNIVKSDKKRTNPASGARVWGDANDAEDFILSERLTDSIRLSFS